MTLERAANLRISATSDGLEAAEQGLEGISKSADRAEKSTKKFSTTSKAANQSTSGLSRNLGKLGPRAQQVSFQLQDMAVQAQAGVNSFTILGQQGSQLAGAFGPAGAVFGAVVALSAAVGGTLFAAFNAASDAAEELEERVAESIDGTVRVRLRKTDELIAAQKARIAELKNDIENQVNAPALFSTDTRARNAGISRPTASDPEIARAQALARGREYALQIEQQIAKSKEAQPKLVQELKDLEEAVTIQVAKRAKLEDELTGRDKTSKIETQIIEKVERIRQQGLDPAEVEREQYAARLELIRQFRQKGLAEGEKYDALEANEKARHLKALEAIEANQHRLDLARKKEETAQRLRLENEVERIRLNTLDPLAREREEHARRLALLEQYHRRRMGNESAYQEAAYAEKKRHADRMVQLEENQQSQSIQILTDSQLAGLSATSQLFGNMAQLAAEGGKDTFDEYKAFASAQAGVAAALAAVQALALPAPPPIPQALAVSIGALAAIQIAKIQGQEYQGRAMGGPVLGGQTYLVGERGPELLTMGGSGTITPNHQLRNKSGGGINVTQVIQVSTGVAGTVRAELDRAMPSIKRMALDSFSQAITQGGPMARAIGAI